MGIDSERPADVFEAEPYHAGMDNDQRDAVQNRFMNSTARIVVTTIAFGMGETPRL